MCFLPRLCIMLSGSIFDYMSKCPFLPRQCYYTVRQHFGYMSRRCSVLFYICHCYNITTKTELALLKL